MPENVEERKLDYVNKFRILLMKQVGLRKKSDTSNIFHIDLF